METTEGIAQADTIAPNDQLKNNVPAEDQRYIVKTSNGVVD
jgi:hypothetical protein|tara:strand:- start:1324 stop:1446 length:123 start_codon:yes stop_codon:yes gene_type:complete